MLKKYRNMLFEVVREKGIDPKLFHVEENQETNNTSFQLIASDLVFFARSPTTSYDMFNRRYTTFAPAPKMTDHEPPEGYAPIMNLVMAFGIWLDEHVKPYLQEQNEPDMWERIEAQIPLVTGSELVPEDTDIFSDDEKAHVRMATNEFRLLLVKHFDPSSDELKVIDDRLKYLSESVERLNNIDWRSVAITTLIAISIALSLDTEKGRLLFDLFKQVFEGALHLIQ